METFITTSVIVLPTFLLIALGYLLRIAKIMDDEGSQKMNVLAFNVLIPAMVFYNIYSSPPQIDAHGGVMVFAAVSITVLFVVLMVLIPYIEKDSARRGVMVQGIFRSSFVVLGMGLVNSMYSGDKLGITAMMSAIIAPLFNGFAVIALETYGKGKTNIKRIAKGIITNPLIIGSALALALVSLDVQLPTVLEKVVANLSATATPLALLVAGASFRFSSIGDRRWQLVISCLGKLVLVPLVFMPIAVMLGFRGVELLSLLVLFGSPNAVSSHIMAYNSGGDAQLAGQIVVFSTCFSAATLFAFIYTLLSLNLL